MVLLYIIIIIKINNIITAIGSDKNITTTNVTQLHNNTPEILSKINIILIIKSITPKANSSLILNYYF